MIWDSKIIMTIIDIVVIAMAVVATWTFSKNKWLLRSLHVSSGLRLIVIGLIILAAFYLVDLLIMFIFPLFMPMKEAMGIMNDLHLNYMWIVSTISIGCIVIGLVYLIRRLFPRIIKLRIDLEEAHADLKDELSALKSVEQKLLRNENKLKELTLIDQLTGVTNRRGYDLTVESEWNRARRTRTPLSLIMLDIDFFKNYNDNYGHPAGDECLKRVAMALNSKIVRAGDVVARYGGEEFVVILPGSNKEAAATLAELLRQAVESLNIEHKVSKATDHVTVSLGVATTATNHDGNYKALLLEADTAMYEAKKAGRNQVKIA